MMWDIIAINWYVQILRFHHQSEGPFLHSSSKEMLDSLGGISGRLTRKLRLLASCLEVVNEKEKVVINKEEEFEEEKN